MAPILNGLRQELHRQVMFIDVWKSPVRPRLTASALSTQIFS
jgi:hypothetical protein